MACSNRMERPSVAKPVLWMPALLKRSAAPKEFGIRIPRGFFTEAAKSRMRLMSSNKFNRVEAAVGALE